MEQEIEYLYRYEAMRCSFVVDAEQETYATTPPRLHLMKFKVVSHTPKGVWITYGFDGKDRWVSNSSRKRYAYPTKEEALSAYRIRKKRYVQHCQARLNRAIEELSLCDKKNKFSFL